MTQQTIEIDEMPITLNLPPIKKGSDYSFTIEMLDDNENPKSTADWHMAVSGRDGGPNGTVLFTVTDVDGISHTPTVGRFIVNISHTITADLPSNKIYWDCKVTDNNGVITYPFEGIFEVRQTVTR